MTNYLKTYVKLLLMMIVVGKGLLLTLLILLHTLLTDISYRSFFHSVDLMRMRFTATLLAVKLTLLTLAIVALATYTLAIYYYWEDVIELIELALVHVVAVMGYFFIILAGLAWRKRMFSGCTYLDRVRKEKVSRIRRKLVTAHLLLLFDFGFCLFLIWDGDFRTVDLTRYLAGTDINSM